MGYQFSFPMVFGWRASRAEAPLKEMSSVRSTFARWLSRRFDRLPFDSKRPALQKPQVGNLFTMVIWPQSTSSTTNFRVALSHRRGTWGPFLESPETFRAHFGWHNSLCIFKEKASRGTKVCIYFNFYSLYKIWKERLYRISGSQFYEWLFRVRTVFRTFEKRASEFL